MTIGAQDVASQDGSHEATLRALEAAAEAARTAVAEARSRLVAVREPLLSMEALAREVRARRDNARHSAEVTTRAAGACGLGGSASTSIVLRRHRAAEHAASEELHAIIVAAAPTCQRVEEAYDALRVARWTEHRSMEALSAFLDAAVLGSGQTPNERQVAVRESLRQIEGEMLAEEEERRRLQDGHFDPRYDERELVLRRARPWL